MENSNNITTSLFQAIGYALILVVALSIMYLPLIFISDQREKNYQNFYNEISLKDPSHIFYNPQGIAYSKKCVNGNFEITVYYKDHELTAPMRSCALQDTWSFLAVRSVFDGNQEKKSTTFEERLRNFNNNFSRSVDGVYNQIACFEGLPYLISYDKTVSMKGPLQPQQKVVCPKEY